MDSHEIAQRAAAEWDRKGRPPGTELDDWQKAQEQLRRLESAAGERTWAALLDHAPAAIFIKDLQGRYLFANRHCEALFQCGRNHLIGKTDLDLFSPPSAEAFRRNDQRVIATRSPLHLEEVADVDNAQHTFLTIKFPLLDSTGQIYALGGIATDISEHTRHKQAEAELLQAYEQLEKRVTERTAELSNEVRERQRAEEARRDSEELYHSLVANLPQNIFRKDREGRFTFVNERFCATLGKPPEALLGKTDADFFPAALAAKYQQDDQRVMNEGVIFETVEEHVTGAGQRVFDQVVKTPLRNARGVVVGTQGIFWDVTEKKLGEEALREREERLQLALEGGLMGTWEWDMRTGQVTWSRSLEAIHGRAPGTFLGTLEDAIKDVHPEDRSGVQKAIGAAVEREGSGLHLEYRIVWPDGSIHWIEGRGRLMCDPHGRPLRMLGVCADITERMQSQRRTGAEHAITRILSQCSNLNQAAPHILQALCENLDWEVGAIWSVDRASAVLRCVEVWHMPHTEAPAFENVTRSTTFKAGLGLPGRIWNSGEATWVTDVTGDTNFPRALWAVQEGLHGAFGFPIRSDHQFLGVIEFFSRRVREPDPPLLRMMTNIGSQIGQFIERRRSEAALQMRAEEFSVARRIQKGLLPKKPPALAGFDIAGLSRPALETSGDYLDFMPLPGADVGIAIADASGHGVGAALIMAETRAYLRALSLTEADPGRILTLANRRLCDDMAEDYFVSLFLARLDPRRRVLAYVNGGHPSGYLLDHHGRVKALESNTGLLGVDSATPFQTSPEIPLEAGNLLLLMTDGILEARSPAGELFGTGRALEVMRARIHLSAAAVADALYQAVLDFARGIPVGDDITAIVLKVSDG